MKTKLLLILFFTSLMVFAEQSKIGDKITSFSANDEKGQLWNLEDNLNQKYLIVYFYPVALTGG